MRCNYARRLARYVHRLFTAMELMRAAFAFRSRAIGRRRIRPVSPSLRQIDADSERFVLFSR